MSARDLGVFLRERRERLRPGDVGLPNGSVRRTPGLRRDEVAARSGMSTEYYTQLEQARGARPSATMLDAMAVALRLSRAEHDHLYHLAGEGPRPPRLVDSTPPGSLLALLARMPETAAMVVDAKQELVAWNALATRLFEDFATTPAPYRNLARRMFLHPDPAARHLGMTRSQGYARYAAAELRAAEARYPHDPALAALITELRTKSGRFERLWQAGEVRAARHLRKRVVHPVVGALVLSCDTLVVPERDQRVVLFTARPRTRSARLVRALADGL